MTTYRCAEMNKPFFEYQGSGKKPYRIVMFQKGVIPSCTCISYKTRLNKNANLAGGGTPGAGTGLAGSVTAWCKHLEHFSKTICQWEMDDKDGDLIVPSACPRCNGPIVSEFGKTVVDTTSATAGLLAIVADLTGKEVVKDDADDVAEDDEPDPLPTNQDAGLINAIVGKEVFAPPAPPVGKQDFDADAAVAELAALLKTK